LRSKNIINLLASICTIGLLLFAGCTRKTHFFSDAQSTNFIHPNAVAIPIAPGEFLITDHFYDYLSSVKHLNRKSVVHDEVWNAKNQKFLPVNNLYPELVTWRARVQLALANSFLNIDSRATAGQNDFFRRGGFPITFLGNGYYILAGGVNNKILDDLEIRNVNRVNVVTRLKMYRPRLSAVSTYLGSNQVLITGGEPSALPEGALVSGLADLFDFKINKIVQTGPMNIDRVYHTGTLLPDKSVLIIGGKAVYGTNEITKVAEIYNPKKRQFSIIGKTIYPHMAHTATLLKNGTVLIAGGLSHYAISQRKNAGNAELFDPKTNRFIDMSPMLYPGFNKMALPIGNRVLLIGGSTVDWAEGMDTNPLKNSEMFVGKENSNGV